MPVLRAERVKAVKYDQLRVVVRLAHNEIDITRRSGCICSSEYDTTKGSRTSLPLMAAGFWVNDVSVVAASYLTAFDDAFNSSDIRRM